VRLVLDTSEVQSLLTEAEHLSADAVLDGELPEQKAFVDAMASQSSIEISPGSYLRILQPSHAVCTKRPHQNPYFVKVLVTTGSAKRHIGWGC
jgi:hypothetical protein